MDLYFSIRRVAFNAATLAEASAKYCAARDAAGEGASTFPSPVVYQKGKRLGRLSYNGRIWPPGEWAADTVPLYCPSQK